MGVKQEWVTLVWPTYRDRVGWGARYPGIEGKRRSRVHCPSQTRYPNITEPTWRLNAIWVNIVFRILSGDLCRRWSVSKVHRSLHHHFCSSFPTLHFFCMHNENLSQAFSKSWWKLCQIQCSSSWFSSSFFTSITSIVPRNKCSCNCSTSFTVAKDIEQDDSRNIPSNYCAVGRKYWHQSFKYKPQVNIFLGQTAPSLSSTEGQKHSYHVNTTSSCTWQLIMHFSGITLETKTMSTTISVDSFEHSVAVSWHAL